MIEQLAAILFSPLPQILEPLKKGLKPTSDWSTKCGEDDLIGRMASGVALDPPKYTRRGTASTAVASGGPPEAKRRR
jgi:hypothetical protein